MMNSQMQLAKHSLFDADRLNVRDIKLYPGTNRDAAAEEMAEQINKALAQIESGDYDIADEFND